MQPLRSQRGAILIMTALLIVVLIGVAALAMDIGRLVVLRSQLQNAADAAAIAAAMELDGKDGARERAKAAAREAIHHDKSFARVQDLLGAGGLPDDAFTFYCVIGAQYDVKPSDTTNFGIYCSGTDDGTGKYASVTDPESHYVRIDLDPAKAPGRFDLKLFFLPVLNLISPGTATEAATRAQAVAGRQFLECNYPPIAICDPFEDTGGTFHESMPLGGSVELSQGSSNQWFKGNFAFLEPITGENGAGAVAKYLASADTQGCSPPVVTTKTGAIAGPRSGFNTRFDIYDNPNPFNKPDAPVIWPPAPNVIGYPADTGQVASINDSRFGNGVWDFDAYWAAKHPGLLKPNAWSNANRPKRWEVYKYEIGNPPAVASHIPVGGVPTHTPAAAPVERRVMNVAVLSCGALGLTGGKKTAYINAPDGFAKFFLTQPMPPTSGGPADRLKIYGEYIGWSEQGDSNYHVETQLYE